MKRKMKKRILNLGCGNNDYGTDFVDISKVSKKVIVCNISKEKLPYADNTFDEVYSSFVFEHLPNPQFALIEMYRVLKKGGKIEIHTNNAGWIFYHNCKSRSMTHYGGYEKRIEGACSGNDDKHFALYTFYHLKCHLKDVGFKKIKTKLYRRDKWWWGISLVDWLLEHSRFKWASYPQIKAEGIK